MSHTDLFYLILFNLPVGILLSEKYKFWITKLDPIHIFFFLPTCVPPYKPKFSAQNPVVIYICRNT